MPAYVVMPGMSREKTWRFSMADGIFCWENGFIRIGGYRAFFTFHLEIVDDTVMFQYLVSRGQAYTKKVEKQLKRLDD